jgi:hypothetical protein
MPRPPDTIGMIPSLHHIPLHETGRFSVAEAVENKSHLSKISFFDGNYPLKLIGRK